MSSITRDTHTPPKSPYWIACYNGVGSDGRLRRFKRSTKTTDPKLARRLADEWEHLEKLAGEGRLTESHCRKVVAEMYERAIGEPLHFRTAADYFSEWLEATKANVELRSYQGYEQTINDFLDHLGAKAERLLREISASDIRVWRDKLRTKGLSARTVNGHVKVLRMPFKAAHDNGHIEINPCAALKPLKDEGRNAKDVFAPEQIAALIKAAPSEDWQGLILCGYFTGLRLTDCSQLKWSNVDLHEQTITVETRKTRKTVTVPIHPQFQLWLEKQTRGIGKAPVFATLAGKSGGGNNGLSMTFRRIMDKANIKGRPLREATGEGHAKVRSRFIRCGIRSTPRWQTRAWASNCGRS